MRNEETSAQRFSSYPWSKESHLQQRQEWIWNKERREETDPEEETESTSSMVDMSQDSLAG